MKRALFAWGGWEGHDPRQTTEKASEALAGVGFDVVVKDTLAAFEDVDEVKSFDLIVPCFTMAEISGAQWAAMQQAVQSGVGFAGWHGGAGDAFRTNTDYQFMVGGQWVAHPGGIVDYEVKILSYTGDPIIEGIEDFKMHSEQYYMHVDPSNETLAVSILGHHDEAPWIKGCIMPAVWKRKYGEGRVFYSSLGHCAADFDVPEVLEILTRGMAWAAR
ncbi:MAG: ThuA domain-containing protein [Armatimonadota bacterium]|jgi:type 1 glutamine amidotransferase